jgi:hypothetical protein
MLDGGSLAKSVDFWCGSRFVPTPLTPHDAHHTTTLCVWPPPCTPANTRAMSTLGKQKHVTAGLVADVEI